MSRFSKSEAEKLGWVFVHKSDAEEEVTSETQGETRVRPASLRAEKILSGGGMINEEADTIGLLLERISAYEKHLEQKNIEQVPVTVDTSSEPRLTSHDHEVSEGENPTQISDEVAATVLLPGGEKITESELVSRTRNDAIVTKESGMQFIGATPEAIAAEVEHQELSRESEDERAAEPDVGPTEQLDIDDAQTQIDLPGGATGGTVLVREGEDLADVAERREAESAESESEKSMRAPIPVAEQAEELALAGDATDAAKERADEEGVDLTQVPGSGKDGRVTKPDVDRHIEGSGTQEILTPGDDPGVDSGLVNPITDEGIPEGTTEGPTFQAQQDENKAREDAIQGTLRDADVPTPEKEAEAREAGAAAALKQRDGGGPA